MMTWESLVNNTVGYNECEHKEAFLLGAHIMHTKLSVQHDKDLLAMKQHADYWMNRCKSSDSDLKALAAIIKRAGEEN